MRSSIWILFGIAALVAGGLTAFWPESLARTQPADSPFAMGHYRAPLLSVEQAKWIQIKNLIRPTAGNRRTTASRCLHAIRLWGNDAHFVGTPIVTRADAVRALTEEDFSRRAFRMHALLKTRYGMRFRAKPYARLMGSDADEVHPDQTLAFLGELGVPLSHTLKMKSTTSTLRAVLDDAVANYDPDKQEMEWTVMAFALYLPPQRSWTNRFEETFSFDDVARQFIEKKMYGASCAGTHLLYTMITLLRADAVRPVLSDAVRADLRAHVAGLVAQIVRAQRPDGSWGIGWFQSEAEKKRVQAPESSFHSLVATGHIGECLLYLPDEMRPGDSVLKSAGSWLWQALQRGVKNRKSFEDSYCPYTHAACVVQALRGDSFSAGKDSARSPLHNRKAP